MPSQQQIHAFSQAFHRVAVPRLHDKPALIERALQTIARWQTQRGHSAPDPYMHEWQAPLRGDLRLLQARVRADDCHAATLRNASPLGFVLSPDLHDLVVSKCAAGRDKDADFARALLTNGSVALTTLFERIAMLDPAKHNVQHITQWTQRRAQEVTE